jgi:hypothetical protein
VDLLLHAQVRSRLAMVTWWPAASCTGSGRVLSRGKKGRWRRLHLEEEEKKRGRVWSCWCC